MDYKYSHLDKKNSAWFQNDNSRNSLLQVRLMQGQIRGLGEFSVELKHPISAISGRNGSGKTTFLALCACAFHNSPDGFQLPDRPRPYFRFSDFFFQTNDEVPLEGIKIAYGIRSELWTNAPPGLGMQVRVKPKGGKWNDYETRAERDVVFFGIERVVPPAEKSVFRSYRGKFTDMTVAQWQEAVRDNVGRVLGVNYEQMKVKGHGKYRLPVVKWLGNTYSGFNMGAGEKALIEIFSAIYAAPQGTLFVIDEIELGLYEQAQRRLIEVLKEIAFERKIQVICTTHSHAILRALPPEARFYLDRLGNKTRVMTGITADYAMGRLAGENTGELDIYVEDMFSRRLLISALPMEVRGRVAVHAIGNVQAVADQCVARFRHKTKTEMLAILDADQEPKLNQLKLQAASKFQDVQKKEFDEWIGVRLATLPGAVAPERWVLDMAMKSDHAALGDALGCSKEVVLGTLAEASAVDKDHNIMNVLSGLVHMQEEEVEHILCRHVAAEYPECFQPLFDRLAALLA